VRLSDRAWLAPVVLVAVSCGDNSLPIGRELVRARPHDRRALDDDFVYLQPTN
jgi:hypothetical protein